MNTIPETERRTGKFGFVTNKINDVIRCQTEQQIGKKVNDGRDYRVNFSFRQRVDEHSGIPINSWRCHLSIFLADYKDTQVGEYCLFPYADSDPHGQHIDGFETRWREVTEQDRADGCTLDKYPQRVHIESGAVFEGWGIWQRVE